jgi:hypothetical protein
MASTRTKNTIGNYDLEQWSNQSSVGYNTSIVYGAAPQTMLPGDGLLAGNVSRTQLAHNSCDVESSLFGINSTNLVSPRAPLQANLKSIPTVPFFDRLPVFIPHPLVVEDKQRPFPIG